MWRFVCLYFCRCFNEVCSTQEHCDFYTFKILLTKRNLAVRHKKILRCFHFSNKSSDGTHVCFILFSISFFITLELLLNISLCFMISIKVRYWVCVKAEKIAYGLSL